MQLFTHLLGFIILGLVCVSLGQPDDPSESNIFQEDESYFLEDDYGTAHGGSVTNFMLPPSDSSTQFQGAETFSRPVIIVSGRNLKDQVGLKEKRIVARSKYDDEEDEGEERPVITETKKKRKRVDQPISAYVPTAYVIGNQGGGQPVSRIRQPVEKDQEYGIMVVSPKQPINENYQLLNAGNYGVNEEMLDRNTIQLYQEPQIVEALSVDGQNEIKEITGDDKDDSLEAQKSKLTLLFLGYEKF
ncbi:uncharacterized protein LOC107369598 [Tetranychus urticae]|uniref:DUF4794 domain-containing protein n=1 Tax=Tetranychus urticae TaxID=32264 RepID=T1L2N3_TETUR|nr:uncharacterized protein LOC107369598 [Tetranychus urticae]